MVSSEIEELLRHFREAFQADPVAAYREWFRAQEQLREEKQEAVARRLADDLWEILREPRLLPAQGRARFLHNIGVFFGSPGPAADLARARECFEAALSHFSEEEESGWHARILHNFATSLSNLGQTRQELLEAIALFERALLWRNAEREIARGVSLHNMGLALRRLAELEPERAGELLERGAAALREAAEIRARHGLSEGRALSLFHLGVTLERLGAVGDPRAAADARSAFEHAAEGFQRLGMEERAALARGRATKD